MRTTPYKPKAVRAILKAAKGPPYVRIDDGDLMGYLNGSSERAKKIHCESVLTESGAFCGVRGKNLHFAQPGGRITCKLCLMYFPPLKRHSDSGTD